MTPKQQAIKKAYGEHYDTYRDIMDNNGWVDSFNMHAPHYITVLESKYNKYWRPASLKGLETNNGWIPVEDRLPDEGEICWIFTKYECIGIAYWNGFTESFEDEGGLSIVPAGWVTHWQPVVKPEAPLY